MKTIEDRERAFIDGLRLLQQQTGMMIEPVTRTEDLGGATLVKSALRVVPLANWQSPPDEQAKDG